MGRWRHGLETSACCEVPHSPPFQFHFRGVQHNMKLLEIETAMLHVGTNNLAIFNLHITQI